MTKLASALLVALAVPAALISVQGAMRPSPHDSRPPARLSATAAAPAHTLPRAPLFNADFNPDLVADYCVRCHNERRLLGNLSLEDFDPANPVADPRTAERMIRKLRAGMMPPPGARRPPDAEVTAFVTAMEEQIDAAAARTPNPGSRSFQRLNRAEYEAAIRDLLGIGIDASAYLPNETVSAGFDNIADVQNLSATLLESYLTAASEISRLALGDPQATPSEATYEVSRYAEQREHVPGAPFGTRGGISVVHNFVADGDYFFRLAFQHESTGNFFGPDRSL